MCTHRGHFSKSVRSHQSLCVTQKKNSPARRVAVYAAQRAEQNLGFAST
jgi:hypothetical protein